MSDLNFSVIILPLLDDDQTIIIDNQTLLTDYDDYGRTNMGIFFDLLKGEINHSIINLEVTSTLTFTINSKIENSFINNLGFIPNDPFNNSPYQSPLIDQVQYLVDTFVGRPIQVEQHTQNGDYIVFDGYISSIPNSISVQSGTQFTLICNTKLSQLSLISSNGSWDDSTQTYHNTFAAFSGNTVKYSDLLNGIKVGTLCSDVPFTIKDGKAKPLPDSLWAYILPNKTRLEVLKEILIPYSRLVYQQEDGTLIIQPLFTNDYADSLYDINCYDNLNHTWVDFSSRNAAANLPNRIDALFAVNTPLNLYGSPDSIPEEIYCSSPKINKSTNKIESINNISGINGMVGYSDIYSTSTRLYNSNKFTMPLMINIPLDNSLFQTPGLLNSIVGIYDTNSFANSQIYKSGNPDNNSIAMLYSQIYLAQSNVQNYNATIVYDYLPFADIPSPLGKIINISNSSNIDYPSNLVMATSLFFSHSTGCLLTVDTAPLLSITAVWDMI